MKKCKLSLLDVVTTPKKQIGVVTKISDKDWGGGFDIAIEYIGKKDKFGEGNAWFDINELKKIDSIKSLLERVISDNLESASFYFNLVNQAMEEDENTRI